MKQSGMWLFAVFAVACGGASQDVAVAQPVAPQPLPSVTTPPPPPPPAPMPHARGEATLTVSFAEVRKHPEGPRIDAAIRNAPAWRAFPTIDPVRDLDWIVQHGDDILVDHATPDASVDAAIAAVAQPVSLGVPGIKAWRGVVNHSDVVFMRAQPHVVRIAPADHADVVAREIVARPPAAPAFHASEAARMVIEHPASMISGLPQDISEARVWADSHPSDASAEIYAELDCPDAAAARADTAAVADWIQRMNSFGVRLMTEGLLNHVDVSTVDKQVHLHVHATQQQIESVLSAATAFYGSGP